MKRARDDPDGEDEGQTKKASVCPFSWLEVISIFDVIRGWLPHNTLNLCRLVSVLWSARPRFIPSGLKDQSRRIFQLEYLEYCRMGRADLLASPIRRYGQSVCFDSQQEEVVEAASRSGILKLLLDQGTFDLPRSMPFDDVMQTLVRAGDVSNASEIYAAGSAMYVRKGRPLRLLQFEPPDETTLVWLLSKRLGERAEGFADYEMLRLHVAESNDPYMINTMVVISGPIPVGTWIHPCSDPAILSRHLPVVGPYTFKTAPMARTSEEYALHVLRLYLLDDDSGGPSDGIWSPVHTIKWAVHAFDAGWVRYLDRVVTRTCQALDIQVYSIGHPKSIDFIRGRFPSAVVPFPEKAFSADRSLSPVDRRLLVKRLDDASVPLSRTFHCNLMARFLRRSGKTGPRALLNQLTKFERSIDRDVLRALGETFRTEEVPTEDRADLFDYLFEEKAIDLYPADIFTKDAGEATANYQAALWAARLRGIRGGLPPKRHGVRVENLSDEDTSSYSSGEDFFLSVDSCDSD